MPTRNVAALAETTPDAIIRMAANAVPIRFIRNSFRPKAVSQALCCWRSRQARPTQFVNISNKLLWTMEFSYK